MSGELVPVLVAAGGGGALLATIAVHEHRQQAAMRRSCRAYELTFPAGASEAHAIGALSSLAGLDSRCELVAEVAADEHGIHHLLHVPQAIAGSVAGQLGAAFPGLRMEAVEARSTGTVDVAVRIAAGERTLLRTDDAVGGVRALLAGVAALRDGERVSLRWALRPGLGAPEATDRGEAASLSARAERRALTARIGMPGFGVRGLLLVCASSPGRAKQLAEHVLSVLRSRRELGGGLRFRRGRVAGSSVMPQTGRGMSWLSAAELLPLVGWPMGGDLIEGVTVGAARRLSVPRELPREGRRLLVGRDAYGERPVALSAEAGLHHLTVVGPSGTGKSTLLIRGVLDALAAGHGGLVLDPKADLARDLLDRVPAEQADRVVVLDPAAAGATPGLDLLSGGDPDLRADTVVGALAAIFGRFWGVRTDFYLRLGVRTLADVPGATLADLARLLTEPGYRRWALQHVRDELTRRAWQSFEALPATEQSGHVQAPLNRVMGLLLRPAVRAVLAAPDPKLNLGRLLGERKLVVAALSPGTLGEPAARLIGSLVMYALWSAIEARTALPPERRRPVFVTIDELASVATLPVSFELLAERARGLGCGLTIATQTLGRLPESLRASLLANCASLVSFRASAEEARRLSAELPGLDARDLMALGRFEGAARVGTGAGGGYATVTGRTDPMPPPTGQAAAILERSAQAYGSKPADPAADPMPGLDTENEPLGRARRQP